MFEDYAAQGSIPVDSIDTKYDPSFSVGDYANFVPGNLTYTVGVLPYAIPLYYSDWRDETLSWHLTCSFYAHLNPSPLHIVRGPDAKRFLSENFVNDIEDFPIGIIKHGVMVLDNGLVAAHGVMLRSGEQEYQVYWAAPYIDFRFAQGDYDAELIDISNQTYVFQLQGPNVLQVLFDATGDDLRDLPFRGFRDSTLNGHPVRIMRIGMSGGLGYEIHGPTEHSREDQLAVLKAGAKHGMRQISLTTYAMNHTIGGFAQAANNFLPAMAADPEFVAWQESLRAESGDATNYSSFDISLLGSVGDNAGERYFNPIEIGLGYTINWNHEFRGKAALQEYRSKPGRRMVTLEWNPDDMADLFRSQFTDDPYTPMDSYGFDSALRGRIVQSSDYVQDAEGNRIGVSIGRTASYYYKKMLSLAVLDDGSRELGSEVLVEWGDPGRRTKLIRATVVRYPYNNEALNSKIDASTVEIEGAPSVTS